jgi:hypothetical protein
MASIACGYPVHEQRLLRTQPLQTLGSLRALLKRRQFSRGGQKMTARFINRLTKRVVERRLATHDEGHLASFLRDGAFLTRLDYKFMAQIFIAHHHVEIIRPIEARHCRTGILSHAKINTQT